MDNKTNAEAFTDGYIEGMKVSHYFSEEIEKIADHYGFEHQSLKAIEESLEFALAIVRILLGSLDIDNLNEETADVLNMAEQLRYFLGSAKIDKIRREKVERTLDKIAKEGEENE